MILIDSYVKLAAVCSGEGGQGLRELRRRNADRFKFDEVTLAQRQDVLHLLGLEIESLHLARRVAGVPADPRGPGQGLGLDLVDHPGNRGGGFIGFKKVTVVFEQPPAT